MALVWGGGGGGAQNGEGLEGLIRQPLCWGGTTACPSSCLN
jgi:hypothetical protein